MFVDYLYFCLEYQRDILLKKESLYIVINANVITF